MCVNKIKEEVKHILKVRKIPEWNKVYKKYSNGIDEEVFLEYLINNKDNAAVTRGEEDSLEKLILKFIEEQQKQETKGNGYIPVCYPIDLSWRVRERRSYMDKIKNL